MEDQHEMGRAQNKNHQFKLPPNFPLLDQLIDRYFKAKTKREIADMAANDAERQLVDIERELSFLFACGSNVTHSGRDGFLTYINYKGETYRLSRHDKGGGFNTEKVKLVEIYPKKEKK